MWFIERLKYDKKLWISFTIRKINDRYCTKKIYNCNKK